MTEAAQGWPFRTLSSEASLITTISPDLCISCLPQSTLLLSLFLCLPLPSLCPSPFLSASLSLSLFSLIKQGQTGFVSLIQTEGVNMSLMLGKRYGRQENTSQVSDRQGRTPLHWGSARKHKLKASAAHGRLPGKPGAFLSSCHTEATATRLEPGWLLRKSIQQPWAVAASR